MSIRTRIAISLNRVAILFAKSCRQSLQRKIAEGNQKFTRIHQERRDAQQRAEAERIRKIDEAAKQAAIQKEQADKIAAAQELKLADKSSQYYASLHELEQGTGIKL
jgi:regulator of protease activity HflC (stomatin/prohibitin superfamily)